MKQLIEIQKKLRAPKSQENKFGGYRYRSCEDILEAVKPLLGECSLTISDEVVAVGGRIYVKATATLAEGAETFATTAFAREPESRKGMDESQITGAASSYARKYALNGLFAIDDSEDGDAINESAEVPEKLLSDTQKENIVSLSETARMEAENVVDAIRWASANRTDKLDQLGQEEAANLIGMITKKIHKKQKEEAQ